MATDRKTVVLDTSVLIAGGKKALAAYPGQEVVIPFVVLQELDKLKTDPEKGWGARDAIKALDELRGSADAPGSLSKSVKLDDAGGTLVIELNHIDETDLPDSFKREGARGEKYSNDVRIIAVAKNFRDRDARDVVFVSNDMAQRVMADAIGLATSEFAVISPAHGGEFSGIVEQHVAVETVNDFFANRHVVLTMDLATGTRFGVNFGVILRSPNSSGLAVCSSYDAETGKAELRRFDSAREAFGMRPRSSEQIVALTHLLNPEVEIVSIGGRAGTGKTALALAAALEQIIEARNGECTYEKIMVFRSPHAVGGQDLGFLPGDGEEKMAPWAAAVWDALSSIASQEVRDDIGHRELIEVLPMTHIRGRSLNNAFVIIDEAQNLELATLMTAISRLGKGSKVVLTWDVAQRDNLHVGRHNGVVAAVNAMAGESIFAHTTLAKTERSRVADLASRVLDDLQS